MQEIRYIRDTVTLEVNKGRCSGCGRCIEVCPHGVLALTNKKVTMKDRDGCMECGACALNCPEEAISVTPGVGCAAYIISSWIKGEGAACCGNESCC